MTHADIGPYYTHSHVGPSLWARALGPQGFKLFEGHAKASSHGKISQEGLAQELKWVPSDRSTIIKIVHAKALTNTTERKLD